MDQAVVDGITDEERRQIEEECAIEWAVFVAANPGCEAHEQLMVQFSNLLPSRGGLTWQQYLDVLWFLSVQAVDSARALEVQ